MANISPIAAMLDRRTLLQGAGALGLAGMLPSLAWAAASFKGASEIQALIDERVAAKQLPGAIVSLSTGAASPDYVMGGTLALDNPAKVDENTIWRIASMTKPVVGMAAMLLITEGKLKIDQPVADFIPGFANMRVIPDPKSSESRPAARLITMRHLLTHTSGLVNQPTGTIAEAYRLVPPMRPPANLEERVNRLATMPLAVDPGTKWIYSPNLDVVARVIELISGMPFDDFLERRIFLPLDMRSTYFWVPERDKGRVVTNYIQRNGALLAEPGSVTRLLTRPAIPSASGGLLSSARDYDRFMAMIVNQGMLDGTRILPAQAVRLGTSDLLPPGTDMSEDPAKTGYDGFGAAGLVTTGGPRPGTYGWGGVAGTAAFVNPKMKTRWSSYTNIGASDLGRRAMAAAGVTFSKT